MQTEADTCRKFVLPKLYSAGWNDDQISEQRTFTDGRIMVAGTKVWKVTGPCRLRTHPQYSAGNRANDSESRAPNAV